MNELVMDIGSKTVRIAKKDAGVIISEPAVTVIKFTGKKMSLVAYGKDVKNYLGEIEPDEQVIFPIKEGGIGHMRAAVLLFRAMMGSLVPKEVFFKPKIKVVALISSGLDNVEKRDLELALTEAGAGSVLMLESPQAAACLSNGGNVCLVDIGASKTEIAIIANGQIAVGLTVDVGGETVNRAITDYVADKYRIIIEKLTTEKLKKSLASLYLGDAQTANIGGKGPLGTPKSLELKAGELREAIVPVFDKLVEAINSVLNQTPERIAESIFEAGITLIGGTAALPGAAEYIAEKTLMKVHVEAGPENANINGGVKLLYDKTELARLLNLTKV